MGVYCWMKRLLRLGLLLVAAAILAVSSADDASSQENQRLRQGKITKNEAEHLVLRKFPGARIGRCELKHGTHHSFWIVELAPSNGSGPSRVRVDGRTGKITL